MMIRGAGATRKRAEPHGILLPILMIFLAWPAALLPSLKGVPVNGYAAVFFLAAGFALLSQPVLFWMGSSLPPFLRRIAGEPAYLAGRYVRDAGSRTAVSVGALVIATALFVSLVVMIHSFRHSVSLWVTQTLAGDFFVRPKMAGLNDYQFPLPAQAVESLKKIPGVDLMPYRHLELVYGKHPFQFEAVGLSALFRRGGFLMIKGNPAHIQGPLLAGKGVLVSEVFSNQTGLRVRDRFRIAVGGVSIDEPVLGIFRDYRTRGGVVYMALDRFQEITGDKDWSGVRFFLKNRTALSKETDRLRREIFRCCGREHPLEMSSGPELRREILDIFDQTFAVTSALLLIALIVAGLGIATTLTVLVLDRMSQLNTLSAIGAGPGQIRFMIFWEAVLMVLTGEIVGLTSGFLMSYFLIHVVNLKSFGWTFPYRVEWTELAIAMPLILATALLAALPAVRLALRSSPALALKEP